MKRQTHDHVVVVEVTAGIGGKILEAERVLPEVPDVLVPRMRLLVRTDILPSAPEPQPVTSGPLLLPHRRPAQWRGRDVGLTVVEQKIVGVLVANAGRPVTYRAIYDQVHYAGFVAGEGERGFERNVRTIIKRLRRKFEAIDPQFQAIRSIAGLGYAWDASE